MIPLYRGFDGLDVSFRAQINEKLRTHLEDAKLHAQSTRSDTCLPIADMMVTVAGTGAPGGYAYRISTGRTGATWFVKRPNPRDPWGVRVSCSSFMLAEHGLGKARSHLYEFMDRLGIRVESNTESIGRVDFAVDILAPNFVLLPDSFVMHSNANRADHIEENERTVNGKSGRTTSVTVGKMPGRQVIVYDKRAEVIAKKKWGWFEIWNASCERRGIPNLDYTDPANSRIWRTEIRAGKRHLKDNWGIRSWSDLDTKLGDLAIEATEVVRLTMPREDRNRARWPNDPVWNLVRQELSADLFEMRNFAPPDTIKRVQKEKHLELLEQQSLGLLITRAAISGVNIDDLSAYARTEGTRLARKIGSELEKTELKFSKSAARYEAIS